MNWKEFLRPEWKKFILPIILIAIFIFVINYLFFLGSTFDKYICQLTSLVNNLQTLRENNQTLAYNQTLDEARSLVKSLQNDVTSRGGNTKLFLDSVKTIKTIDPFVPVPCEIMPSHLCQYYLNKESYDCIINANVSSPFIILGTPNIPEYNKVSFITIGLNILFLFVEGYLISCLIALGYNKFKKKK